MAFRWFVKILIMIILFGVRYILFDPEQGGPITGFLFVGERVLASNLASDGSSIVMVVFSFIITLVIYYIVAEIITYILMKLFVRK